MPRSITSPASSGGHLSSVDLTASMIRLSGSSIARRTSAAEMTHGLRQAGDQVPAADLGVRLVGGRERGAERQLDLLGGPLAEHQASAPSCRR